MYKINLNLGRNCLKYIIRAYGIREIFIPYYICPVIIKAVREENCKIHFYHIDNNFIPLQKFSPEDFILYVNYFGINTKNCRELALKYPHLIVDNSHAYFAPHLGFAGFNSMRKFFPVPNGAELYINKKNEQIYPVDKTNLQPVLFYKNYEKFVENELMLNKQTEIKTLSSDVENLIKNTHFDKRLRVELFKTYAKVFDNLNNLKTAIDAGDIPYCYPLSPNSQKIAEILAEEFCLLRLWKDIPSKFPEYEVFNNIIALPLDDYLYCNKIVARISQLTGEN